LDESSWSKLVDELAQVIALPNLKTQGLMTMPPLGETAEFSRTFFQKLKRLQEYLASQFPQVNFSELSMGTSTDFEVSIQEGATLVRVGTAIVGPRQYKTEA
jgi:PLP dependent protein